MKANFIIELNEKHANAMNNTQVFFEDVDINIIPSIGWRYEYVDNDETYCGKIIKIGVFKSPSTHEEELYITIDEN